LARATVDYRRSRISLEEVEALLGRDLERGTTSLGPHLQDVEIQAGGRDLRSFGSQGEQRLGVLALLLAEALVLAEKREEPPLLLLDDVLSELDEGRRLRLIQSVPAGSQLLVAATSLRALPPTASPDLVVEVVSGKAAVR
jgi:DNA replication and repair protein RecF